MNIFQLRITKIIEYLADRFNFVLFITAVSLGLIIAISILGGIVTKSFSSETPQTGIVPSAVPPFDQNTISRMGKYESSTNNSTYKSLPATRLNPFWDN